MPFAYQWFQVSFHWSDGIIYVYQKRSCKLSLQSDNPSVAETEIIRENLSLSLLKNNLGESVNIMVEDALLPCIIRSSANMQGTCVLVFDKEGFQQHAPSQSAEVIFDNDNNNNNNNDNNDNDNINNKCIDE